MPGGKVRRKVQDMSIGLLDREWFRDESRKRDGVPPRERTGGNIEKGSRNNRQTTMPEDLGPKPYRQFTQRWQPATRLLFGKRLKRHSPLTSHVEPCQFL